MSVSMAFSCQLMLHQQDIGHKMYAQYRASPNYTSSPSIQNSMTDPLAPLTLIFAKCFRVSPKLILSSNPGSALDI